MYVGIPKSNPHLYVGIPKSNPHAVILWEEAWSPQHRTQCQPAKGKGKWSEEVTGNQNKL